jgi:NADPH:quinone reductase-like Zn-dependent oxidoreductase
VIIGMQGGVKGELNIATLLNKRGAVIATSLRGRSDGEKAAICAAVAEHVWPLVADGQVTPVVHATMPLARAGEAHALMEAGEHVGKIVLTVD